MKTAAFYLIFLVIGFTGSYGLILLASEGSFTGEKEVKRKYGRQPRNKKDESGPKPFFFGYKRKHDFKFQQPRLDHYKSRSRSADVIQLD